MYKKICVYCAKEYSSDKRNQRYCSESCCKKAQKLRYKKNKAKEVRRRRYHETREVQLILSSAYKVAERVATLFLEKKCAAGGTESDGPVEIHHKDGNPLNNDITNLIYLSKRKHAQLHTLLPKINVPEILHQVYKGKDIPLWEEMYQNKEEHLRILKEFLEAQKKKEDKKE